MHQFGIGVEFDLHLAKRLYDSSLEAAPEAEVAVALALWTVTLMQALENHVSDDLMKKLTNYPLLAQLRSISHRVREEATVRIVVFDRYANTLTMQIICSRMLWRWLLLFSACCF
jgi:hypothetical protein